MPGRGIQLILGAEKAKAEAKEKLPNLSNKELSDLITDLKEKEKNYPRQLKKDLVSLLIASGSILAAGGVIYIGSKIFNYNPLIAERAVAYGLLALIPVHMIRSSSTPRDRGYTVQMLGLAEQEYKIRSVSGRLYEKNP
jgi:flagellar biosynthesis regulator FlaF